VLARILDTPPFGGGTALTNSFMLSRGLAQPGESTQGPQGLLFHEMIHGFVGGIEGPQGVTSWFSEGLTSYYTTVLELRGGFGSVAEYGESINAVARDYYTNEARNWSAARIVETGFNNNDIRHLPYRRGQLYFADLDSKIRAASGGRRNLDLVMRELFERRRGGWRFDHDAWREIVTREAGPQAAAEFDALIIDGTATIVPASDAFGPCFARQPTRFGEVEGYRWERVAGVPDSRCLPR
jgi:predicted metalloprotease with PDZ domain